MCEMPRFYIKWWSDNADFSLDRRFDKTAEAKAQDDDDSSNIVYSREALSGLNTSVKLRTFDPVAEEDTTDLGIALQRNYSNYWKNRSPPAKANSQKKGSLNKLQEAPA